MFKSRTLLLFSLSVIFALGAAMIANNWMQQQRGVAQAAVPDSRAVVVAAMDIPYGQMLEARHLKLQTLPVSAIPANTFVETADVVGKVVDQPILSGEILRAERVADALDGATLAALIDPQKRAIAVRVNDVVGVAGFLLPGNRVDVVATRKDDGNNNRVISRTVLRDIKVLAVDQTARTDKNDPVIVRAVTLEVTPQEAEDLTKARDEGNISLTLRNPVAEEVVAVAEPEPAPPPVRAKPAPKKVSRSYAPPSVIIIKGVEWEKQKVPM
jgi:pilus assembly protein CpaB